ncbi:MAG: hypothetical protein ACKOZW_02760 [Cyanobium sp.]
MPITVPILEAWLERRPLGGQASQESLRTSSLGCHASWFRDNLGQCSNAMLQYEWAWMDGRLAALAQCGGDASIGPGAPPASPCPPEARLAALLTESQLLQTLLLQEFTSRGLRPLPPLGPVVASEEAWEITSASVRQTWGIQP